MCSQSFFRDIFLITLLGIAHKTFLLTNTFSTYEQMPIQSLFAGHHLLAIWAHERGVIITFPCHMGLSIAKFICAISTGLSGIFLVLIATSVDIKLQMNTAGFQHIPESDSFFLQKKQMYTPCTCFSFLCSLTSSIVVNLSPQWH